jgi:hypothetical protein
MNRLPPEILLNIFSRLHVCDKVEVKRVCRNWWRILDDACLFKNAELSTMDLQFKRFMAMMKHSPHVAARVEELQITLEPSVYFNKGELVTTFSNAKVIKMVRGPNRSTPWRGCGRYSNIDRPIEMACSTSKLRVLHDCTKCELAAKMLECNLCPKLEELELNFYKCTTRKAPVILNRLKDLPALKKLALIYTAITITDLEKIHKNIPTIQEFKLCHANILPSRSPPDIVPALSLTAFEISIDHSDLDTDCQHYQYMNRKYPNITKIKHYNRQLVHYTSDQRRHVHLNGLLDFYKRIINTNTGKLTICGMPNDIDIFEIYDASNYRLEKLKVYSCPEEEPLFQHLSQSYQSNYVKRLVLHDTVIGSLSTLKTMMALTDLKLSFHDSQYLLPINMTDYLNGTPPTIKRFSIDSSYLEVDPQKWQLYSIETLEIRCREIDVTHVNMISALFPKLIELKLSITTFIGDNLNLRLYYPTFQRAIFTLANLGTYRSLTFESLDQAGLQGYIFHQGKTHSVLYEKIQSIPNLTVSTLTKKKVDSSSKKQLFLI